MKNVRLLFKNVRFWSLLLLILSEISLIIFIRNYSGGCLCIWEIISFIPPILLIVFLAWNHTSFSFDTKIVAKLLASVIQAAQGITITYLIFFILHVACLGNAVYNFSIGNNVDWRDFFVFVIISIGFILLMYTFPNAPSKKANKPKIFISGISKVRFFKDGRDKSPTIGEYVIEQSQLYPLVRAFKVISRNIELRTNDKVYIVWTTGIDKKLINDMKELINIMKLSTPTISFVKDSKSKNSDESVERFNTEIKEIVFDGEIKDAITKLIKLFAKYAFYEDENFRSVIDNIEIIYTKSTNYDDFDDCYKTINNTLKQYPNEDYDIVINCTPGTATLSSALSILSMEDNRRLLYYNQNESVEIEDRMKEIAENKLDFKELVEQVAEELSN